MTTPRECPDWRRAASLCMFVGAFLALLTSESLGDVEDATDSLYLDPEARLVEFVPPPHDEVDFSCYREQWQQLSGLTYSGSHWGQLVRLFINENASTYLNNHARFIEIWSVLEPKASQQGAYATYPPGTSLIKENFLQTSGDAQAISLTIMVKRARGYDPEFGDWEYLQSDPLGNVIIRGNSTNPDVKPLCVACHANVAERDYVYSTASSEGLPDDL